LICCPQGIAREEECYLNTYPAVWMAGEFDYAAGAFRHGELHELDAGFEFYAPQTMLTSDGRRLLVGWMGVPEGEEMLQPTLNNGWIHQMTCLRELEFINGQLYQRPLRELSALRGEANGWSGNALPLAPMEIDLQTRGGDMLSLDFGGVLTLECDASGLRLARRSLASDEMHYRYWRGDVRSLHIFIDQSSVEIFINGGEGVMSSRYFPACSGQLTFFGITPDAFCYWPLRTCMVE
ncbi:TPA: GH32 C-terminal domain-containing protein, partial [Escherichia coli]